MREKCGHIAISHREKRHYVHTLVLLAFSGPRPEGQQCRHLNGDPGDNRPSNLCWGTCAENAADRIRHGTVPRGAKHCRAKLTDADVITLRSKMASGISPKTVAAEYGLTVRTVFKIAAGKSWTHLPLAPRLPRYGQEVRLAAAKRYIDEHGLTPTSEAPPDPTDR